MTPGRTPRRRLTAVTALAALTLVVAGVDVVSSAVGAQARGPVDAVTTSAAVAPSGPVTLPAGVVPVSVPAGAPFELDVVAVTVTPDRAPAVAPTAGRPGDRAAAGTAVARHDDRSGADVREVAAATLAGLPASGGVRLVFDSPELAGHLGGVFLDSPGAILLNATRLAGDPARTRDVVRHEIAHVYQARLAATRGLGTVGRRLDEVFGPGGLERSADCVALALGADWTHYTTDCAGADRAAAVEALLTGRMP